MMNTELPPDDNVSRLLTCLFFFFELARFNILLEAIATYNRIGCCETLHFGRGLSGLSNHFNYKKDED